MEELVIKLKMSYLKKGIYLLIILALAGVIAYQYYYPNCSCNGNSTNSAGSTADAGAGAGEDEQTELDSTEEEAEETPVVTIESDGNESDENNETVNEPESDGSEEGLLPITGEIKLIIDEIKYVLKGEDYARVTSVKYTIVNQKTDFTPTVKAYLEAYKDDDVKSVELEKLDAGKSIILTEKKFTFGYNNIAKDQVLTLELYNGKSMVKKTSKTFKTK